jgi:hypothetical protein
LGYLDKASPIDDYDWLGDLCTPPEKLFALAFEALVRRTKEVKKRLARIRIGNLASLEGFPAFDRFYQCLQLMIRALQVHGISVVMSISPPLAKLSKVQSFREDTTVLALFDGTSWRIDAVSRRSQDKFSRSFDVFKDLGFKPVPSDQNLKLPGI